jgi:uncharacterized protein YxjI
MSSRGAERREQKREDRKEFGVGGSAERYMMKQRMFAFGDNFWIENERGKQCFKVDGKMMRVRDTLLFEEKDGTEHCKIQQKVARIKDSVKVDDPHDKELAMVKMALITPVRERWVVKMGNGPDLEVQGNILDHEYTIGEGRDKIAEVSKRWFRVRDSYGVQIEQGQDDLTLLAVTVAIDMMAHPDN